MSFLKHSCQRASAQLRYQRMPIRLATERADKTLSAIGSATSRDDEPWELFAGRVKAKAPVELRPRDLKRLTYGMWSDENLASRTRETLTETVRRDRKSFDRIVIKSYLTYFPTEHPSFADLTAASKLVAGRRDWPWQTRGEEWALWDSHEGPRRVAKGLLETDQPDEVLRSIGLEGDLASGRFVAEALISACTITASRRGPAAEDAGKRLVRLFTGVQAPGELLGLVAYALLAPWVSAACDKTYERTVSQLLVSRLGDPRMSRARWSALQADVSQRLPDADVESAFAVLRRWLVQATVRQFFSVVAQTTDRKDQWKQRTEFWLGYLDAGVISEAWFAFGAMAERLARGLIEDETVSYGNIEGGGADASHSALVFNIGDIRISEWSHNGRARFWQTGDSRAPLLYRKKYNGNSLRAMSGGQGFEALSHNGSWEPKFAKQVYRMTGIKHPRHGAGW
jgi:hypothetical protein